MLGTIAVGSETRLRSRLRVGGRTTTIIASSGDVNLSQWHHAALTYDGSNLRLYLDGVEVGIAAISDVIDIDPTVSVAVGSQPPGAGNNHFDGLIDDVRILQRALIPEEIAEIIAGNRVSSDPGVPGNLAVVPIGSSRTDLFWDPSVDDIGVAGYDIYRDSVLVASTSQTSWSDTNISGNEVHIYEVIARDGDGNQSAAASSTETSVDSGNGPWWNSNWPYRLLVGVGTGSFTRFDRVAEIDLNFTQLLADLGDSGDIDLATIRCHEVDKDGLILASDSPCQFDPAPDFDVQTLAKGELMLLAAAQTPARTARYYHVYFDTVGGSSTPATPATPLVAVTDDVFDEDQFSYQVSTSMGDYLFQKQAGGFSSLNDNGGNDRIDYHPTGGAAGNYRGIPNLVYPEGHFHPGSTSANSSLVHVGPLKATTGAITQDGYWEVAWEIYPTFATMTVLAAAREYWFLYEGVPGGILDVDSDFSVRADGSTLLLSTSWSGDLPADQWVYFADPGLERSLFLAQHEDDASYDSYRPLQDLMTVFGFGREDLLGTINLVPAQFTIGFIDTTAHSMATELINSAIKPIDVVLSEAVSLL